MLFLTRSSLYHPCYVPAADQQESIVEEATKNWEWWVVNKLPFKLLLLYLALCLAHVSTSSLSPEYTARSSLNDPCSVPAEEINGESVANFPLKFCIWCTWPSSYVVSPPAVTLFFLSSSLKFALALAWYVLAATWFLLLSLVLSSTLLTVPCSNHCLVIFFRVSSSLQIYFSDISKPQTVQSELRTGYLQPFFQKWHFDTWHSTTNIVVIPAKAKLGMLYPGVLVDCWWCPESSN